MTNNEHLQTLIEAAVDGVSEQVRQIAKEQGIKLEKPKETSSISFNNN